MMFVFIVMAACGGLSYVLFASEDALGKIADGQESGSAEFESVSDTLQTHFDQLWCPAGINATSDYSTWNNFVKDQCNTDLAQDQVCDPDENVQDKDRLRVHGVQEGNFAYDPGLHHACRRGRRRFRGAPVAPRHRFVFAVLLQQGANT